MDLSTAPRAVLPLPFTVPLPGRWTFWADTIVGGVPLGPVGLSAFTCSSVLSGFGSGAATIELPCGIDTARILRLWSWRLWALYEGIPVWCGVPTGVTDTGTAEISLTLTELTGYLAKRQMDVYPTASYAQIEQTAIAADLAAPVQDVGVFLVTVPGAGFKRDRSYDYLSGNRADLLTELSQVISGPEFRAEYSMMFGRPGCTLRIAYPRVGLPGAGLGVNINPSALGFQAQWDSDQLRTRTFAVGALPDNAADGTPTPVAVVDKPQADLPRLDAADDWSGAVLTTTLQEQAATSATQQAAAALTLSVTPSEASPDITTYGPGDDVTLTVTTPLLPGGLTVLAARLMQIDIDAAAATAAWTLSMTQPPPRARETLAARLDRIDTQQSVMFRSGPKTVLT